MEALDDLQRPVRTAVINEQDLHIIRLIMQDVLHGIVEQRDGLFLIEDRDDQGNQFHLVSSYVSAYSHGLYGQRDTRYQAWMGDLPCVSPPTMFLP